MAPSPSMTNGWAAVIFHPSSSRPLVFNGTVPPKLLKHFASNKAFIYFLEAWAAIITPILVKPLLTPTYIQLCDNDAATHAIIKGSPLNNLLGPMSASDVSLSFHLMSHHPLTLAAGRFCLVVGVWLLGFVLFPVLQVS